MKINKKSSCKHFNLKVNVKHIIFSCILMNLRAIEN